jgi:hypothetical protein
VRYDPTPAAIIREAAANGVSLTLSPTGTIKAVGDQVAVTRWLPVLREHKPDIVKALAAPAVTEEAADADRRGSSAMTTLALLQAAEAASMAIRLGGRRARLGNLQRVPPRRVGRD